MVPYGVSPARAVSQAYFLLETITAFANAPSAPSLGKLRSSMDEQAVSSAPVDPFASEHIMYRPYGQLEVATIGTAKHSSDDRASGNITR